MKKQFAFLVGSALAVAVGCSQGNPGGPGANRTTTGTNTTATTPPTTTTPNSNTTAATGDRNTNVTTNKPIVGEAENTFTLSVPTLSTTVKQGESKTVKISIDRGKNFDEDVTLEFSGLPQGITLEPERPMIKHGEKEDTITVHAANDAALGDFTVKVMGHPTQGADATNELKLTVKENK